MLEKLDFSLRGKRFEALRKAAARAKRHVTRNRWAAGIRRNRTWRHLLKKAAVQGIAPESLHRVYEYLSIISKVRLPDYVHPQQRPVNNYFPGLTAKPFHDTAQFEWTVRLEKKYEIIRDEVLQIYSSSIMKPHHQNLTDEGRWDTFYFCAAGKKIEKSYALCPETAKVIDSLPTAGSAGHVYFSVLSRGTHIKPHCGPTNVRLRCHFGLVVPYGSRLRVGSATQSWQPGKCLIFDDSFEHEVWNVADGDRIVLILDAWHPELTDGEKWAIDEILRIYDTGHIRRYRQSVEKQ
jgi:hypothetical protein